MRRRPALSALAVLVPMAEDLPPAGAMRAAPRARFVLLFITDLADHYAQMANYMRILGMVPPSALPPTQ